MDTDVGVLNSRIKAVQFTQQLSLSSFDVLHSTHSFLSFDVFFSCVTDLMNAQTRLDGLTGAGTKLKEWRWADCFNMPYLWWKLTSLLQRKQFACWFLLSTFLKMRFMQKFKSQTNERQKRPKFSIQLLNQLLQRFVKTHSEKKEMITSQCLDSWGNNTNWNPGDIRL